MHKCLFILVAVCVCFSAEKVMQIATVLGDSVNEFIPDPKRIAQNRIKILRSFKALELPEPKPDDTYPLTLSTSIQQLVLLNNEIKKAKLSYLIGEKRYRATFGVFEPQLSGSYEYSESGRPDALLLELRESWIGGVEGIFPSATRYSLSISQKDVRFPQSIYEWPMVSSTVSVTQPLLKDFWGNGPFSDIKIAKAERQISYNRYRSTLMTQCFNLERAYWKLVFLQEKRRNAEKSVMIARRIVNESPTLVASGIISKLDAVEVNSQLAQRQLALSEVKVEHVSIMNELIQMIGYSPDSGLIKPKAVTPLPIVPKEQLADTLLSISYIDSVITVNQPELLSAEFTRERSRVAVSQLRGKALPELNLKGVIGVFGASRNIDYAVEQFYDVDKNKHNWAWVLEMKLPLGTGIRDRNLLKAEKLNLHIAEIEKSTLRNELITQTLLASEKKWDLAQNLSNAEIIVKYRTSLMESELVRLRAGLSNVRKIFEIEQDLADAREKELEMRVDYQLVLSLHDRLLGITLLRKNLESIVKGKPVLVESLVRE
jgi:outer membrane protein TolC